LKISMLGKEEVEAVPVGFQVFMMIIGVIDHA
jgi:hypothetical protein